MQSNGSAQWQGGDPITRVDPPNWYPGDWDSEKSAAMRDLTGQWLGAVADGDADRANDLGVQLWDLYGEKPEWALARRQAGLDLRSAGVPDEEIPGLLGIYDQSNDGQILNFSKNGPTKDPEYARGRVQSWRSALDGAEAKYPGVADALDPNHLRDQFDADGRGSVGNWESTSAPEAPGGLTPATQDAFDKKTAQESLKAPANGPDPAAAKGLKLMSQSAVSKGVMSKEDADARLDAVLGNPDPEAAHKDMAKLMTELKLGGKQRKRYREMLDAHHGTTADSDSDVIEAQAVSDGLAPDNPLKEKLDAKIAEAQAPFESEEGPAVPGAPETAAKPTRAKGLTKAQSQSIANVYAGRDPAEIGFDPNTGATYVDVVDLDQAIATLEADYADQSKWAKMGHSSGLKHYAAGKPGEGQHTAGDRMAVNNVRRRLTAMRDAQDKKGGEATSGQGTTNQGPSAFDAEIPVADLSDGNLIGQYKVNFEDGVDTTLIEAELNKRGLDLDSAREGKKKHQPGKGPDYSEPIPDYSGLSDADLADAIDAKKSHMDNANKLAMNAKGGTPATDADQKFKKDYAEKLRKEWVALRKERDSRQFSGVAEAPASSEVTPSTPKPGPTPSPTPIPEAPAAPAAPKKQKGIRIPDSAIGKQTGLAAGHYIQDNGRTDFSGDKVYDVVDPDGKPVAQMEKVDFSSNVATGPGQSHIVKVKGWAVTPHPDKVKEILAAYPEGKPRDDMRQRLRSIASSARQAPSKDRYWATHRLLTSMDKMMEMAPGGGKSESTPTPEAPAVPTPAVPTPAVPTPTADLTEGGLPTAASEFNWPAPGPGVKVYQHPQGARIYVNPDGSMAAFGSTGKPKKTSATPEKLAAGHGQWAEITPAAAPAAPTPSAPAAPAVPKPAAPVDPAVAYTQLGAMDSKEYAAAMSKMDDATLDAVLKRAYANLNPTSSKSPGKWHYAVRNAAEREKRIRDDKRRKENPTAAEVLQDLNDYDAQDELPPNINMATAVDYFRREYEDDPDAPHFTAKIHGMEYTLPAVAVRALLKGSGKA